VISALSALPRNPRESYLLNALTVRSLHRPDACNDQSKTHNSTQWPQIVLFVFQAGFGSKLLRSIAGRRSCAVLKRRPINTSSRSSGIVEVSRCGLHAVFIRRTHLAGIGWSRGDPGAYGPQGPCRADPADRRTDPHRSRLDASHAHQSTTHRPYAHH